uniref:CobW C-terminal domain-containing protein n=1 Tax=Compsopogon caeruleus TaxID=31354 RepID=A0A7S1TII8_9RHOD
MEDGKSGEGKVLGRRWRSGGSLGFHEWSAWPRVVYVGFGARDQVGAWTRRWGSRRALGAWAVSARWGVRAGRVGNELWRRRWPGDDAGGGKIPRGTRGVELSCSLDTSTSATGEAADLDAISQGEGRTEPLDDMRISRIPVIIVSGCVVERRRQFLRSLVNRCRRVDFPRMAILYRSEETISDGSWDYELECTSPAEADVIMGDSDSDNTTPPFVCEPWQTLSDAVERIKSLAGRESADSVVIESDSVLETEDLVSAITSVRTAKMDCLIAVLDGTSCLRDICRSGSDENVPSPDDVLENNGNSFGVVSLVEMANVVVVAGPTENMSSIREAASLLNSKALLFTQEESSETARFVNVGLYDRNNIIQDASWHRVLVASDEDSSTSVLPRSLKDSSLLYRAKRPFHPTRLYNNIKDVATFEGVLRSKGRFWLATRMDYPLEWEQAGDTATIRKGYPFLASQPDNKVAQNDVNSMTWDDRFGDRESVIVFLGKDFDKSKIQDLLNGCLLLDEEMVFDQSWESFEDPFQEWVSLDDDEDEDDMEDHELPIVLAETQREGEKSVDESDQASEIEVLDERIASASVAGVVSDISEDLMEKVSALDVLQSEISLSGRLIDEGKDFKFREEDVLISSWDTSVADDILEKIPRTGLPVTIITGFLGSGKTTLLNYILGQDHGLKIAVLVNEFGEIDIDNQLVEKGDWSDDDTLTLSNGCICCSINESFLGAVDKILDKWEEGIVDYLVVETTGVADPTPIISSLLLPDYEETLKVDGIVTLVDAENFIPEDHMGSEAALSQISVADTILLSKTDLATPKQVETVIEFIKTFRPGARILRSQRGRVPLNMILDVGIRLTSKATEKLGAQKDSLSSEVVLDESNGGQGVIQETSIQREHRSDAHLHDNEIRQSMEGHSENDHHGHEHDDHEHHDHEHHDHDHHDHNHENCTDHHHSHSDHLEVDGFVSSSFKSREAFDPEKFLDNFLQKLPAGVFRAKGLLYFHGYTHRYIFQLSGRRYQFEEDDWPANEKPCNQLVVIGRDLDKEELSRMLEACVAGK